MPRPRSSSPPTGLAGSADRVAKIDFIHTQQAQLLCHAGYFLRMNRPLKGTRNHTRDVSPHKSRLALPQQYSKSSERFIDRRVCVALTESLRRRSEYSKFVEKARGARPFLILFATERVYLWMHPAEEVETRFLNRLQSFQIWHTQAARTSVTSHRGNPGILGPPLLCVLEALSN